MAVRPPIRRKRPVHEEEAAINEVPKLDLSVTIKNFGPLKGGTINLKPLTIFVGPNNSGKSYAAMLIHSILSAENNSYPIPRRRRIYGKIHFELYRKSRSELYRKFYKEIRQVVRKNKKRLNMVDFMKLVNLLQAHLVNNVFKDDLKESITLNFGSSLQELVRSGYDSASISIKGPGQFLASLSDTVTIKHKDYKYVHGKKYQSLEKDLHFAMKTRLPKSWDDDEDFFITSEVFDAILKFILNDVRTTGLPPNSYYFPAARSGLLQGHRALSAGLVQNAQFAGAMELRVPRLTGVVSDFIMSTLLLPEHRGFFYPLAEKMESDMLRGHVTLEKTEGGLPPEMIYRTPQVTVPLYRASSTVSEVAPLSLYLKYSAIPRSLLIIEEPEAHLHLENQAEMAKYIVRMVRANLNVLVTTHSSAIIDELSMYIQSKSVSTKVRRAVGLEATDVLELDDVAAYFFGGTPKSGHTIREIKADIRTGIPHVDYNRALERLFNRTARIEHETPDN